MDDTVHGILQARILEWVAFHSPGDLPNPGIKSRSPALQADSLPAEPQGKPMQNAGLDEAQAGIKMPRELSITSDMQMTSPLWQQKVKKIKSLWMKVKEESEKDSIKLNVQKMNIMASSPITSWQIDGETVGTVSDFIFWGSKITADVIAAMKLKDAYSLEEKL